MRKLFYIQSLSIVGLLITMFIAQYYVIKYFSSISSLLTLGDLVVYFFMFLALFLSINRNFLSSIIIIMYGVYILINLGVLLDLPIIIFNSLTDGRIQFGCSLLFNIINIVIGVVLLTIYFNKLSKEDAK